MIQAAMYFALGFLTAGLLALLVMPAIWRRAARLTRARVEAAMPMTLAEIEADKDQLRANFAVANRRLELEAETLKQKLAEVTVGGGRSHDEISALTRAKAALADAVGALEERVAELTGGLSTTENKLATANAEIAAREQQLAQQTALVAELQTQFHASQVMTEELRMELVARNTEIANLIDNLGGMTTAHATATTTTERLAAELSLERDRLVAEQKRADGLAAGLAALQAERIGRIADLDRHAGNLKTLDTAVAAERQRSAALLQEIETLKAHQADAMAEGDNFRKAASATESEKASLLLRLAALEDDYAALRAENAELRRVAGAEWESERQENRQLRERLNEIAIGVVRLAQAHDNDATGQPPSSEPPEIAPILKATEPEETGATALADRLGPAQPNGTRH